jgi:hypothetical protein
LSAGLPGGDETTGLGHDAAVSGAGIQNGIGALSVLASASTLVCCTIPAILVVLGAGSVLASLVSWVPGIVWLSENKPLVFVVATTMMLASAVAQRAVERLPCPADPALAAACAANRRRGRWLFRVSLALLLVGATFAFVLPALLAV